MASGTPYIFNNLGGGINKEAAPYALSQGQARDTTNWHTSPSGIIKKRNGCPTFSGPSVGGSNQLTSLFALHTATRWIVGAGGTKLFKIATNGVSADLATSLTANKKWDFIQAPASGGQGPLYGLNGTDTPKQWDGSAGSAGDWTTAGSAAVPNGKFLDYHNNRVLVSGVISNPARLYESKLLDPRIWDTPDAITVDFDPSDGQDITAQGKNGPYFLIFKPRKTYVVTNTDAGSYRALSSEVGCVANRTVIETPVGTFFLSTDGSVYITDGNTLTDISLEIRPLLRLIPSGSIANASAFYKNNSYYLSVSDSGADNNQVLEYDTQTKTWWPHKIYTTTVDTAGLNDFTLLEPNTTSTLYGALAGSGTPLALELFKDNTYQDLGAYNYLARWDGPWHVFDQPHIRKNIREIRVDALGYFDLYTARNFATTLVAEEQTQWETASSGSTFGGSGTFGGAGIFGDENSITETRYYTPGTCRAMSLRIESQNNLDCQIYAYTVFADMRAD